MKVPAAAGLDAAGLSCLRGEDQSSKKETSEIAANAAATGMIHILIPANDKFARPQSQSHAKKRIRCFFIPKKP